jgi:hypothetical protein
MCLRHGGTNGDFSPFFSLALNNIVGIILCNRHKALLAVFTCPFNSIFFIQNALHSKLCCPCPSRMPHHLCDWHGHSRNQWATLGTWSSPFATQVWSKFARQGNSQGVNTGLGYVGQLSHTIYPSQHFLAAKRGAPSGSPTVQ